MSDRIELRNMVFLGRHGVLAHERTEEQPFEVDVELALDLRAAGLADDLALTIDYGAVFASVRSIVEGRSVQLIETLAEAIAREILARHPADAVTVRVRKPNAPLEGRFDWAGVEVTRTRADLGGLLGEGQRPGK